MHLSGTGEEKTEQNTTRGGVLMRLCIHLFGEMVSESLKTTPSPEPGAW